MVRFVVVGARFQGQPAIQSPTMSRYLREGCGVVLLASALLMLGFGVRHLRDQEFVGAVLLTLSALMLVRAGVELLRPSMGE